MSRKNQLFLLYSKVKIPINDKKVFIYLKTYDTIFQYLCLRQQKGGP